VVIGSDTVSFSLSVFATVSYVYDAPQFYVQFDARLLTRLSRCTLYKIPSSTPHSLHSDCDCTSAPELAVIQICDVGSLRHARSISLRTSTLDRITYVWMPVPGRLGCTHVR